MSGGEAESWFCQGWMSGESNPQAKGWLLGHPSVGAADDEVPYHLFPQQGTCPSCSAMGRAPQHYADSALGVSGDTRDDLQASEDSWEMGRPGRAIRET